MIRIKDGSGLEVQGDIFLELYPMRVEKFWILRVKIIQIVVNYKKDEKKNIGRKRDDWNFKEQERENFDWGFLRENDILKKKCSVKDLKLRK